MYMYLSNETSGKIENEGEETKNIDGIYSDIIALLIYVFMQNGKKIFCKNLSLSVINLTETKIC